MGWVDDELAGFGGRVLVADVDQDGAAELIVVSGSAPGGGELRGEVFVFKGPFW